MARLVWREGCSIGATLGEGPAGGRISDGAARINIAEVDRRSFLAQAETLHDQALRLGVVAGTADVNGLRDVLASIRTTCNSCHERFRDFSGSIGGRSSKRHVLMSVSSMFTGLFAAMLCRR